MTLAFWTSAYAQEEEEEGEGGANPEGDEAVRRLALKVMETGPRMRSADAEGGREDGDVSDGEEDEEEDYDAAN